MNVNVDSCAPLIYSYYVCECALSVFLYVCPCR